MSITETLGDNWDDDLCFSSGSFAATSYRVNVEISVFVASKLEFLGGFKNTGPSKVRPNYTGPFYGPV